MAEVNVDPDRAKVVVDSASKSWCAERDSPSKLVSEQAPVGMVSLPASAVPWVYLMHTNPKTRQGVLSQT